MNVATTRCDTCTFHRCSGKLVRECKAPTAERPTGVEVAAAVRRGVVPERCPMRDGDITVGLDESARAKGA